MKKYELTTDIIQHNGITLYRIRALINMPKYGIKVGDLGGYIQFENNLSHEGYCWVKDNAKVYGKAQVYDNALVRNNAWVYGNARVYGSTMVFNNVIVCDNARVYDKAKVYNSAKVYGNTRVYGKAKVYDSARVYGNARVYNSAQVFGNADVFIDAWVFGDARVYGDSKLLGYIHIGFSTHIVDIELNGIHSFNDFIKLYPIEIKDDKAILYKAVHKINNKYMSNYDKNFEYKLGQIHQHECDSNICEDCSYGLHIATKEWAIDYCKNWKNLVILEVEVPIDKLIIPLSSSGKLRTSELRIICEIPIEKYE